MRPCQQLEGLAGIPAELPGPNRLGQVFSSRNHQDIGAPNGSCCQFQIFAPPPTNYGTSFFKIKSGTQTFESPKIWNKN